MALKEDFNTCLITITKSRAIFCKVNDKSAKTEKSVTTITGADSKCLLNIC